jgi:hypothetical protein
MHRALEALIVTTRTTVSAAQLYTLLDAEFRRLRPATCHTCRMPMPYGRTPPDDVSANWHIGTPPECPHRCHVVIAELLARMWTLYDMCPERQN